MIPHYKNIHNRFKINGFHLEREALFQLAYSFIKEGAPFEIEFGEFFPPQSYIFLDKKPELYNYLIQMSGIRNIK